MMEIVRHLVDAGYTSFEVEGESSDVWNSFLTVLSYCYDISEAKNMSCPKHGIVLTRPCSSYLVTMNDIGRLQESTSRHLGRPSLQERSVLY